MVSSDSNMTAFASSHVWYFWMQGKAPTPILHPGQRQGKRMTTLEVLQAKTPGEQACKEAQVLKEPVQERQETDF